MTYVPGPIGRDQARDLARRELEKQAYHRDEPSFVDRMLRKITDWLNALYDKLPGKHTGGSGSWAMLVILVVLLVLVAAAVWWRVGNVRRNAPGRTALLDDAPTRAEDHRTEAARHAASSDWPQAIRERLRAIARDLEERAIVQPRPGRTADELATEAGEALPDHAGDLARGVRVFDDVWYGGEDGDEAGYHQLTELDERLHTAKPVPLATAGERGA